MISLGYFKGLTWLKLNVKEKETRGRTKENILGARIRRMLMRYRNWTVSEDSQKVLATGSVGGFLRC